MTLTEYICSENIDDISGTASSTDDVLSLCNSNVLMKPVCGSSVLIDQLSTRDCGSDLNLSISFATIDERIEHQPISVQNETVHSPLSDSANIDWDAIDGAVLAESSAGDSLVINDETEDLLQEFEELWTDTYPQLDEAVEQASSSLIGDIVASTLALSIHQKFTDRLSGTEDLEDLFESTVYSESFSRPQTEDELELSCKVHSTVPDQSFDLPGPGDLRLGQLLVDLNLINKELLERAMITSVEMSISVGRALIMLGWLTSTKLQWSVQLQALLRDNVITLPVAVRIAELMSCPGMTIQRALNCVDKTDAFEVLETRATRLGDLLIQSELLSEEEFFEALNKSQTFGVAVGRYLVISGLITAPLLESVMNAQRYIREGKMQKADAIVAIRRAARRQYEIRRKNAVSDCDRLPIRTVRVGEILTLAGVVTEAHLEQAVEFGLRCNQPVGQVLVDSEILSKETLDVVLVLQSLVLNGSLEPLDAVYALIDVHHHGYALEIALKRNRTFKSDRKPISFEQFVAGLELLSPPQIEDSLELARRSPMFVSKALVMSGALTEATAQTALTCHFYVREDMLTTEESLLLFNLCHRTGLTVEEGIAELGLKIRSR